MAIEDHNVRSRAASYQKLVREQILAILGLGQLSIERSILLSSLLSACAYLITRRKYVLIKKDVLNKHMRLLTRLYGITIVHAQSIRTVLLVSMLICNQ